MQRKPTAAPQLMPDDPSVQQAVLDLCSAFPGIFSRSSTALYRLQFEISHGSSGSVWCVYRCRDGKLFALKILVMHDDEGRHLALQEIACLEHLRPHFAIVPLIEAFVTYGGPKGLPSSRVTV